MPKPVPHAPGNGLHINVSLNQNGHNLFNQVDHKQPAEAEWFIAGILDKTPEMTAFLNPLPSSYQRLGLFETPAFVSWSKQNRSSLVRIPAAAGQKVRMELRSPDPSLNPYLAFALVIAAGLDGIEKRKTLPQPLDGHWHQAPQEIIQSLTRLPADLEQAVQLAQDSSWIQSVIGTDMQVMFCEELRRQLETGKTADQDA